jgi:hypothetical protein
VLRGLRHTTLALACVAALLCGPAAAGAAAAAVPAQLAPADGAWLLEHDSSHGTLRRIGRSGAMLLTLRGLAPRVRALARGAGDRFDFQALGDFVRSWHTYGFDRVAPRAAIVAARRALLVRLSTPRLDSEGDLSYLARPLRGPTPAHLRYFASEARSGLPSKLGRTSVFIDDANNEPVNFEMAVTAPYGWGGSVGLSTPSIESVSGQASPVSLSLSASSVLLELFSGTGEHPEQLHMKADPLGECLMVTLSPGPNSPAAQVAGTGGGGPIFVLHSGLNGLPIGGNGLEPNKCPDEPGTTRPAV